MKSSMVQHCSQMLRSLCCRERNVLVLASYQWRRVKVGEGKRKDQINQKEVERHVVFVYLNVGFTTKPKNKEFT